MIFANNLSLSHTITMALQNAQLKAHPLITFVSDVFDPLSTDVMKDIQEHVVIRNPRTHLYGTNPVHKTSKDRLS